jgi:hypothetical protein
MDVLIQVEAAVDLVVVQLMLQQDLVDQES